MGPTLGPDGRLLTLADLRKYYLPEERGERDLNRFRDEAFARRWKDAQQQAAQRQDRVDYTSFQEGDLVLMKEKVTKRKSFGERYKGPFMVVRAYDNYTYILRAANGHVQPRPINREKLKLFRYPESAEDSRAEGGDVVSGPVLRASS